jgi:pimeloyl-ACP methyl ester carboxylesterase
MTELAHRTIPVVGAPIHYVECGSGEPVVLVHGFPEFWYSWREQIPALSSAGFRAVALDLPGYNLSHKPQSLDAYAPGAIAEALVVFIEEIGRPVSLVGHDWGAVACWLLAARRPEILRKLAIVNIPHPGTLRAIRHRGRQVLRLSYQLLFRPRVTESLLRARRFFLLRMLMKAGSRRKEAFTPDVFLEYERAWSQPGALTGMLNYYRAIARARRSRGAHPPQRVRVPTLLIYGAEEPVFLRETIEASAKFVDDLRIETLQRAAHFAHQDEPDAVNGLLIEFLRG